MTREMTASGPEALPAPAPIRRRSFRESVLAGPVTFAWVLALLFWFISLTPTLLPRTPIIQAVVGAFALLVGNSIGVILLWIFRPLWKRLGWKWEGTRLRFWVRVALGLITAAAVVAGAILWYGWQKNQAPLVDLEPPAWWAAVVMVVATAVMAFVLLAIGRSIGWLVKGFNRLVSKPLGRRGGWALTTAVVVIVLAVIFNDFIFDKIVISAGENWENWNTETDAGASQPTSAFVSGGPGSLTPWDTLGREGRNFASHGASTQAIAKFWGNGKEVKEPIRVYAGLEGRESASAMQERAALAVEELERTGGFERKVLVVWSLTGTGWVDPTAAHALEYMWAGDTAIVALQYSYLPSVVSFLVDAESCAEGGRAIFEAVYDRWSELPADSRPYLLVYGESLGSRGVEAAFTKGDVEASVDDVVSRTQGMLLVGPTESNTLFKQLEAAREPDSLCWKPAYDAGEQIRFVNRATDLTEPAPWELPHTLYLMHPSDPVAWWNWSTAYSRPDWTKGEKGYDVPQNMTWFPVVTWIQVTFDLIAGFSSQDGYGHNYNPDLAAGWAAVFPPPGWTKENQARLEALLDLESVKGLSF